ncbi:hypothetical protein ES703_69339 [subsurface metagenome]
MAVKDDKKVTVGLAVVAGLIGLAVATLVFAMVARAAAGFKLRIANAPSEAVWFIANFAENLWNYDPPADSGALPIDTVWEYPSDPLGCTTLMIQLFDTDHNKIFEVRNLGPVENGKSYVFDYATGELIEE